MVNISLPIGGVASAIDKFKVITTPKWTGSLPKDFAIGTSIMVLSYNNLYMNKYFKYEQWIRKLTTNQLLE